MNIAFPLCKKPFSILLLTIFLSTSSFSQHYVAKDVKVTILSTMLAQQGIGEWGFSALIEVDSNKLLFDAGGRERTVLENAKELNIDLSTVPTLVLSHWHDDHTKGWLTLRKAMVSVAPTALSKTHVAKVFFDVRFSNDGKDSSSRKKDSTAYVYTGGKIIEHRFFEEILPGVYVTGNVPRVYNEKNYYPEAKLKSADNHFIEDNIPDDMSLVIATKEGLVLISGCGHAGIINTITHINKNLAGQSVIAAIGGFHLLKSSDEQIQWTADNLKKAGVKYFMGAHCTGIDAVYQIRNYLSLKRGDCVVGSVGDTFDIHNGFTCGDLNR
ncbi:MAG: MBL fold metallo-hydrolase [Bacteroidota bacterium]|nr:MBL fold metallo-hydrolase [Bacteroidota bacterium]